jgi:hypothetical protein
LVVLDLVVVLVRDLVLDVVRGRRLDRGFERGRSNQPLRRMLRVRLQARS